MSLQDFKDAYWEALFWSEVANDENGEDLGPMDDLASPEDLDPTERAAAERQLAEFYENYMFLWRLGGWSDADAGHDFALTRNGHGTGFWDRGREHGDDLAAACRPYGSMTLTWCGEGQPVRICG